MIISYNNNTRGEVIPLGNLLFSINTVMPLFLIMIIGWFLRRLGMITAEVVQKVNQIVFYLALPASMFLDLATADIREVFDAKFVLFAVGVTVVGFIVAWVLGELVLKDKSQVGAFVQGAFRSNYVFIGVALVKNVLQVDDVAVAQLVIAFVIPFYNVLSVLALTTRGVTKEKVTVSRLLKNIATNPLIISILIALPFSLLRVQFPFLVTKTLDYCGTIATPLALMMIGANFNFGNIKSRLGGTLLACAYKLVLQGLIFIPIAVKLGFGTQELLVLLVMLCSPTAANSYIMAKNMGGDSELASSIIVGTTLFSVVTLTAWIFVFRTVGIL
ncbi:AEC family transporter [Feifania hominis]